MTATTPAGPTGVRHLDDAIATAVGRHHRADPELPRIGGPAGNARLTAWIGLLLLVGFAVEGLTLLDVGRFINWHIAVGALLVPPALVKTGTTSWRIVRYYTGHRAYVVAGPPPLVLRIAGPLVVLTTLGLLGSGLALIALGPAGSRGGPDVLGRRIDAVTLHQLLFFVWLVPMTVHVLGRTVPAVQHSVGRRLPGLGGRLSLVSLTAALAALAVVLTLSGSHPWTHGDHRDRRPTHQTAGSR